MVLVTTGGHSYYYCPIPWPWYYPMPDQDQVWGCASCGPGYEAGNLAHYYAEVNYHYDLGGGGTEDLAASARTEMKLYTGGKAGVNRLNLFCINAGADEYFRPPPSIDGTPWWNTDGTNIPPTQLLVMDKHPGTDGNLWIVLPDDTSPVVTVKAPGKPHYNAWASQQKYKPTIKANGHNLEEETPEYCAGEKVNLEIAWNPALTDGIQSYQWIASLNFIDKIVSPATNIASTSYVLDLSLLTNNPAHVWWYDGGYKFVWCVVNNQFSNGQTITLTKEGNLTIYKPEFVGIINKMPNQILVRTNTNILALGNGSGFTNDLSMHFDVQTKSKRRGNINLTQLIKTDRHFDVTPITALCYSSGGNFYLDNGLDNGGSMGFGVNFGSNTVETVHYFDSPSLAGSSYTDFNPKVDITDSFKVYVQFTLNEGGTGDNIPVTLAILRWNWEAHSQKPFLGEWQLTGTNYISDITTDPDNGFPVWYNEVNNNGDYDLCW